MKIRIQAFAYSNATCTARYHASICRLREHFETSGGAEVVMVGAVRVESSSPIAPETAWFQPLGSVLQRVPVQVTHSETHAETLEKNCWFPEFAFSNSFNL
jgi:hypothetical protein